MNEVKSKRVDLFEEMLAPGDFKWHYENDIPTHLTFLCPCGCGAFGGVRVSGEHAWGWNGDLENPTTTPSIRFLSGCEWHGYLTNGIFIS